MTDRLTADEERAIRERADDDAPEVARSYADAVADRRALLAELDAVRADMRRHAEWTSTIVDVMRGEYEPGEGMGDAIDRLRTERDRLRADLATLREAVEAGERSPGCPDHAAASLSWCDNCERATNAAAQLHVALEATKPRRDVMLTIGYTTSEDGRIAARATCPHCSQEIGRILRVGEPARWDCALCRRPIAEWSGDVLRAALEATRPR